MVSVLSVGDGQNQKKRVAKDRTARSVGEYVKLSPSRAAAEPRRKPVPVRGGNQTFVSLEEAAEIEDRARGLKALLSELLEQERKQHAQIQEAKRLHTKHLLWAIFGGVVGLLGLVFSSHLANLLFEVASSSPKGFHAFLEHGLRLVSAVICVFSICAFIIKSSAAAELKNAWLVVAAAGVLVLFMPDMKETLGRLSDSFQVITVLLPMVCWIAVHRRRASENQPGGHANPEQLYNVKT